MKLIVGKSQNIAGKIKAPPSKSYTHRAIIISALATGNSILKYPLKSEDTVASLESCRLMGCSIREHGKHWLVEGSSGKLKTPSDVLDVKNSGTTLRMMTSVAALAPNYTVFTGDDSLRNRPMQDLLDALQGLGVDAYSTRSNGKPPIVVGGGFNGGSTSIRGNVSSQFISSLLIAGALSQEGISLKVEGDFISRPYVDMTRDVMNKFGVKVEYDENDNYFQVDPQTYQGTDYTIEGDYSSASYLIAAASILEGDLTIQNLFKESKQGDKLILDIAQEMGASIKVRNDEVKVEGSGELQGIDVNLNHAPDLLPTVAALGAVARGRTTISGVEHARLKETDRISTCTQELSRLGVEVQEKKDGMVIKGGAHPGVVKSHGDHRLVMALSLVGLKVGITIENAGVYDVSFPDFPQTMSRLGTSMKLEG